MEKTRKKEKSRNKYLLLTSVSFQMGVTFYFGIFWFTLDEKYMFEKKWSTISLILIALFFSIYNILKQLKKINNEK